MKKFPCILLRIFYYYLSLRQHRKIQNNKKMARTIDYARKAEKIKEQIDELLNELESVKAASSATKKSLRISDLDLDNENIRTLQILQARIARIILEKSK